MTDYSSTVSQIVYVKYESVDGSLNIAKHVRPALLSASEEADDFIRDIVHNYKSNPDMRYLGLADEDEFAAFERLHASETSDDLPIRL